MSTETDANRKISAEEIGKGIGYVLKRKGIEGKEQRIYLFLAREGVHSAGKIAKNLEIGRVQTYRILSRLEDKGVIESIIENPILYSAVPFKDLMESVINKERNNLQYLEENKGLIIENIAPRDGLQDSIYPNKFSMIKGKKQYNSKILQLFRNANKELLMNVNNFHIIKNFQYGQLDKIEKELCERSKILIFFSDDDESKKTIPVIDDILASYKNIKFHYFLANANSQNIAHVPFFILSEKECIYYLNVGESNRGRRDESALWTNSKFFIDTQKKIFEDFWQRSELLTSHCLWPD